MSGFSNLLRYTKINLNCLVFLLHQILAMQYEFIIMIIIIGR
jgi:hypothetical protein